jgi:hypothetical protein
MAAGDTHDIPVETRPALAAIWIPVFALFASPIFAVSAE